MSLAPQKPENRITAIVRLPNPLPKPKRICVFAEGPLAEVAWEAGADLVGSNCGNGIEKMIEIAREFRAATDRPVIIQANAGLPNVRGDQVVYDQSPEFMADKARELLELGVSVVGGCCGTTPDHIRALSQVVKGR